MIGVMSDSHDNCHAIQQAVRIFTDMKCELVLHAGDFIAPFAAKELAKLPCPVRAVFGNCDGEKPGLEDTLRPFGEIKEAPHVFTHAGRVFLLTHTQFSVKKYAASQKYNVIVFGHTHRPEIREANGTLLINPGETGGWVSGKGTVALLDTTIWGAEIITL